MYTIKEAIKSAINEAERKFKSGKLLKSNEISEDFTNGDPETIYSIASIYAQFVEDKNFNDAVDGIEEALFEIYPEYI